MHMLTLLNDASLVFILVPLIRASSQLTVGARALEKHCHRDTSNNWWGRPKGSKYIWIKSKWKCIPLPNFGWLISLYHVTYSNGFIQFRISYGIPKVALIAKSWFKKKNVTGTQNLYLLKIIILPHRGRATLLGCGAGKCKYYLLDEA